MTKVTPEMAAMFDKAEAKLTPNRAHSDWMFFNEGMTKRELIAMHALAGMITGYAIAYGSPTNAPDEVAREAVGMADALLAALGEQS